MTDHLVLTCSSLCGGSEIARVIQGGCIDVTYFFDCRTDSRELNINIR